MAAKKIRIGVIFGGQSREREVSFAGGRTVYDNLNKSIFDAIPVFADSFGNFCYLNWEHIYKGTIRDFYPPVEFLPAENPFQLYSENLNPNGKQRRDMLEAIGKPVGMGALKKKIDFAFLCLHGPFGEDGRIQGLLEYAGIPYSGSGILPSAIGINKAIQKDMMKSRGFAGPEYFTINRHDWIAGNAGDAFKKASELTGFPCVVKPGGQGSSIGITVLEKSDKHDFMSAVEKAMFTRWLDASQWQSLSSEEKFSYVKSLSDIREGVGMPLTISYPESLGGPVIYDPAALMRFLDTNLKSDGFVIESLDGEETVLVESFIKGKEFSCIVIEDENGNAIALPPTEIRKGGGLFDYRSKYLPGLSRKITPIDLPEEQIEAIRKECERLFSELHFDVYARIDGFLSEDGKIYLNDPNTTSGMMPSSFFFHQAAEIGLNPSQFLTFIIRTSVNKRIAAFPGNTALHSLLNTVDKLIAADKKALSEKLRVAVILGGYSSERHISVESGRNVYEKLSSSDKYAPFPVFLSGDKESFLFHKIPINLMLKDNADDIAEKIRTYKRHSVVERIVSLCSEITDKYSSSGHIAEPLELDYTMLKQSSDVAFIALHGRPGEDGALQAKLDDYGIPYNGSDSESSSLTIDKYRTNQILKANGFKVADHLLISKTEWVGEKDKVLRIFSDRIGYPFIAKPVDDGCSSAVKKIRSAEEFESFCRLIFREQEALDAVAAARLNIKEREEFPMKDVVLVEELITKKDAAHFLEITGGLLTRHDKDGSIIYEVFEASEALADAEILSLEEKFLAGQGQNITPARYSRNPDERNKISEAVKREFAAAAKLLNVTGYCRIDAFVRIYNDLTPEVIFIEVNSLPGMTPATCIFHQAAIKQYRPYEFINRILEFGRERLALAKENPA